MNSNLTFQTRLNSPVRQNEMQKSGRMQRSVTLPSTELLQTPLYSSSRIPIVPIVIVTMWQLEDHCMAGHISDRERTCTNVVGICQALNG
jgi:hypothetical protein